MLNYEEWEKQLPDHVRLLADCFKKMLYYSEKRNEEDSHKHWQILQLILLEELKDSLKLSKILLLPEKASC